LRFDGPQTSQVRIVTERRRLHGRELRPGDRLFLFLSAVNRDPRAFAAADEIRLERKPNPHVTFGHGQHVCMGAPLARLEGQLAFPRILARWPTIALARQPGDWERSLVMRGVRSLSIRVGQARASSGGVA
ncbi:MAG: cytochrome P450, partial [Burkholderiales bacterium]